MHFAFGFSFLSASPFLGTAVWQLVHGIDFPPQESLPTCMVAIAVALLEGSLYLPISNFWFAVLVLAIYMVLINLKGIWLRPRLMGRSVDLNEGLVFVAIIVAVLLQVG